MAYDLDHARDGFAACPSPVHTVSLIALHDVDAPLLAQWENLSRDLEQPNPFFAPWFLRPAIARLGGVEDVRLLLLHDESGMVSALMPVVRAETHAHLPVRHLSVWKNDHLYVGTPLVRRGHAGAAMAALVAWIGRGEAGIRFLRLTQLCAGGPVHRAIEAACIDRKCATVLRRCRSRAILRRGHDFDALMAQSHSTKRRAELRRRCRRFDEMGAVSLHESPLSPKDAPSLIDAFMRLESEGWKGSTPEGLAVARTAHESAFFREAMQAGAMEGHVIATVLSLDDAPVAIGLTLRCGDALFGFKTAFDRTHGRHSPGLRIFHETTRRMLADPAVRVYDSCAMPDHPVIDVLWPDRMDGVDIDILARGTVNIGITRLATEIAAMKDRLSGSAPD